MSLPRDPAILLSYINTQLRDFTTTWTTSASPLAWTGPSWCIAWRTSAMSMTLRKTVLYKSAQRRIPTKRPAFPSPRGRRGKAGLFCFLGVLSGRTAVTSRSLAEYHGSTRQMKRARF